ncbi:hypothetical protein TSAR_008091 [Trichomalopsis sarcophagae]|uniref:Uncharacterized protein n=1 Tax=Trichomalopsis sarcophagae TaxID=543379 RepID=A0A232FP14_9HYME|nr:hypothetical protein TSAR_008091 [Trichomalopsis sarcophagae]
MYIHIYTYIHGDKSNISDLLLSAIAGQHKFCVQHDKDKPLPFTGLQLTGCVIIYCDDACAFFKKKE